MKKGLLALFIFSILLSFSMQAQNYWKTYRKKDGLIDNVIVDIAVGNKIYLATPKGFSVFSNESFVNYDTSNSDLISNNVLKVRQFNDTVYLVTDSGLSQFVNGSFINYTVDSGLISNEITDVVIDSKGEVWIGSRSGISIKVGNAFLNDPSRVIVDLAINSGDTIYANVNTSAIANVANPATAEYYFNGSWNTLRDTALKKVISAASFVSLSNGRVAIASANKGAYLIDSLFKLQEIVFPVNFISTARLNSMDIDNRGNYWFAFSNGTSLYDNSGGLFRWNGSNFDEYRTALPSSQVNAVRKSGSTILIGTTNGLAIAIDTIEVITSVSSLETESFKVSYLSSGELREQQAGTFEFPKGSGRVLFYDAGIWTSGIGKSGKETASISGLGKSNDFNAGSINSNGAPLGQTMIKISKAEISAHLRNFSNANYQVPPAIRDWPANGRFDLGEAMDQAPFVDVNENGCYDPELGDYPFILGDEAIFMVINDQVSNVSNRFESSLGIEVHLMAYVFDLPQIEYIDQTVFLRYTIINRTTSTIRDFSVGFHVDIDIGGLDDDFFGCDPASNIFFGYNGDNFDENRQSLIGYGALIPFVGGKFIDQSMEGFIGYNNTDGNLRLRSPFLEGHFINGLKSRWQDSIPIAYGGNGYNSSQQITNYLYSGDITKTAEWSAINPGPGFAATRRDDIAVLSRLASRDLEPNERFQFDLALGVGFDSSNTNYLDNYQLLISNLNRAARFQIGIDSIAPKFTYAKCTVGVDETIDEREEKMLLVYPNPAKDAVNLLSRENILEATIFDLQGKIIHSQRFSGSSILESIGLKEHIPSGMYVIRVLLKNEAVAVQRLLIQ